MATVAQNGCVITQPQLTTSAHTKPPSTMQTKLTMLPGPYETYFGGKGASGAAQTIINHIRPHDVYLELFVGNGYVFRAKRPADFNLINDLNEHVYDDWLAVSITHKAVMPTTHILNCNATDWLASYAFTEQLRYCVYLDPPYPISSRSQPVERYAYEMTDEDHRELLNVLRYLPDNVDVLISTYANPIYAELLHDWQLVTFQAQTQRGPATEYLYMNYIPDGTLHDYRYLGTNRTDRQRIRRKIAREVARLRRLPVAERNAIVDAVRAFAVNADYDPTQAEHNTVQMASQITTANYTKSC